MKKILFITLSNIGDVVLTTPVLQNLLDRPDHPAVSVMVGPKAAELFWHDPAVREVIVYDKLSGWANKLALAKRLSAKHFDEVVDVRNTLFPLALLGLRGLGSLTRGWSRSKGHASRRHLRRAFRRDENVTFRIYVPEEAEHHANELLKDVSGSFVAIAPGAASDLKRWSLQRFASLARRIVQDSHAQVVLLGDAKDQTLVAPLKESIPYLVDLTGRTTLLDLAAVLKRSKLFITNDSGPMHIAVAVGTPVIAIFGPSDAGRYGPIGEHDQIMRLDLSCSPCSQAQCPLGTHACMEDLQVEQVWSSVEKSLRGAPRRSNPVEIATPRKILFVRTDRIGDVLVSTPAIRALRKANPQAWISVMVAPAAYQAVQLNPDINEVLVYDKRANWWRQFQLWRQLRLRNFDLAIIAHCTNPVNWLVFLAGIPERIGHARRAGYLLTRPLPNVKVLGEKHEAEYVVDLVRILGAESVEIKPHFYFDEEDARFALTMMKKMGINGKRPVVAVHAGSSSPSKCWPKEYFAKLVERLAGRKDIQVILVGGTNEMALSQEIVPAGLENQVVDFTGLLNLRELGAVLARCALLVSADSGPVHVAVGVGTSNVTIFGRSRPGLGPKSWGPLGANDTVIQKDVGCKVCLADDCEIDFKCLKELTVEEVYQAVLSRLEILVQGRTNDKFTLDAL